MEKLLLILLFFPLLILAQTVPQGIEYQGIARDTDGNKLTNQSLIVKFSVISGGITGIISWQETHLDTTNNYGLFTAVIGQGEKTSSSSSVTFDVVDWSSSNYFLKVEIDYGSGYVDMGTTQFINVPFNMNANTTDIILEMLIKYIEKIRPTEDTLFFSNGNYIIISGITPLPVQIGEFRDGGVVFWVDSTEQHGLVCDIQDLGVSEWGCYGLPIPGADGTAIGTGHQNTNDILARCLQAGIAAALCNNSTSGGYNDWFLPSKDELNQMYINKRIIEATNGISPFSSYYWSSSESNLNDAWFQYFFSGFQYDDDQDFKHSVRAVRFF